MTVRIVLGILQRPGESDEAYNARMIDEARDDARAEFRVASPYRVGKALGRRGCDPVSAPYALHSRAWACFRAGIRDGFAEWMRPVPAFLPRCWFRFDPVNGDGQPLPAERRFVALQLHPLGPGRPPAVALGYLKLAAGDRSSPRFIVPGIGGDVAYWCDCLPEDLFPPLWKAPT